MPPIVGRFRTIDSLIPPPTQNTGGGGNFRGHGVSASWDDSGNVTYRNSNGEIFDPNSSESILEDKYGSDAMALVDFNTKLQKEMMALQNEYNISSAKAANDFAASEAEKARKFNRIEAETARNFNSSEAEKNRQWQEMMSNTAHQREVEDLISAGLNPILAAGGQGAAVTSGSFASGQAASGSAAAAHSSSVGLPSADLNTIKDLFTASLSAATQLTSAQISADSKLYSSEIGSVWKLSEYFTNILTSVFGSDHRVDIFNRT